MRIAQIVPLWEQVPPPKYGGTQRVAHFLTEGLVAAGHDVTLFATGDSKTSAKLVSVYPRALNRDGISWEDFYWPTLNAYEAFERQQEFDVIHYHIDRKTEFIPALFAAKFLKTPVIFTMHFAIAHSSEAAMRRQFLERFKDLNFISISNSQRSTFPPLNFVATVYNGIDTEEISFQQESKDALVWLGRFSEVKGAREAIEIAHRLERKLILAGKLDTQNAEQQEYFTRHIEPKIDGVHVEYIGEVDAQGKNELFSQAVALLNPIQWDEPFGLAPVEAMAAGVPVIAFRRGAMPELIVDGKTGFLVDSVDQAVAAFQEIGSINRAVCRSHVVDKFSRERMTSDYISAYESIVQR